MFTLGFVLSLAFTVFYSGTGCTMQYSTTNVLCLVEGKQALESNRLLGVLALPLSIWEIGFLNPFLSPQKT